MSHVCRFCSAHIFKFEKGGKKISSSSSFLGTPRGILKVVCVCPSIELDTVSDTCACPSNIRYRIRHSVPVRRTFDTVSDTMCLSVEYSILYLTPCGCPSTLDSVSDSVCLSVKHSI